MDCVVKTEQKATISLSPVEVEAFGYEQLETVLFNENNLVSFLQGYGLIAQDATCTNCTNTMKLVLDQSKKAWFWTCNRKPQNRPRCISFKFSVQRGTVFEESKLSLNCLFRLMYHFAQGHEAKETSKHTGIGDVNGDSVRNFFEVLHNAMYTFMENRGVETLHPFEQTKKEGMDIMHFFCTLLQRSTLRTQVDLQEFEYI